jgi:hypothetical protein
MRCRAKSMRCRASELAIGLTWYDNEATAAPALLRLKSGSPVKKFLEDHKAWL